MRAIRGGEQPAPVDLPPLQADPGLAVAEAVVADPAEAAATGDASEGKSKRRGWWSVNR